MHTKFMRTKPFHLVYMFSKTSLLVELKHWSENSTLTQ